MAGSPRSGYTFKNAKDTHAHLVLIDETGLFSTRLSSENVDGRHWQKFSVIGGVSVSPIAQRLGFCIATESDGFFTSENVVPLFGNVLKHVRGKAIVVGDHGTNHKGQVIRDFHKKSRHLHLEMLQPWAPNYYPMEDVRS